MPLRSDRCAGVELGVEGWREGAGWCGRGVSWGEGVWYGWSNSKSRPSHLEYRSQTSFCESHHWRIMSWRALTLRELNALWALPVHPVFEDEKSSASDEKSKIKNHRTNIIAKLRLSAINYHNSYASCNNTEPKYLNWKKAKSTVT